MKITDGDRRRDRNLEELSDLSDEEEIIQAIRKKIASEKKAKEREARLKALE